jgi:hypothetical protein
MAATPGPDMREPHHDDVLEFVDRFTSEKSQPFVQTTDVSGRFSEVSKRTVYSRLDDLEERGELEKRCVGANSTVWWPAGQEYV